MNTTVCYIAKPIDCLHDIAVYPWFDLAGQSATLDRAWRNYIGARRKAYIPDDQENWARQHGEDFDTVIMGSMWTGEYLKPWLAYEDDPDSGERRYTRMPGEQVEVDALSKRLKPFAVARHSLDRAIEKHLAESKSLIA